jgi:hypothetical protein
VLSFRVSRLDAFFALAVFMLGGRAFAEARSATASRIRAPRIDMRAVAAAVVLALAVRWQALTRIEMDSAFWLPERDAVTFIKTNGLRGNMLTYFDWGEYAIWHLSPSVKVSMDGRRETVYGSASIDRHLDVYRNHERGLAYVRQLNPDLVWLPKALSVVSALRASNEWRVLYEGPESALLARHPVNSSGQAGVSDLRRVFPGP